MKSDRYEWTRGRARPMRQGEEGPRPARWRRRRMIFAILVQRLSCQHYLLYKKTAAAVPLFYLYFYFVCHYLLYDDSIYERTRYMAMGAWHGFSSSITFLHITFSLLFLLEVHEGGGTPGCLQYMEMVILDVFQLGVACIDYLPHRTTTLAAAPFAGHAGGVVDRYTTTMIVGRFFGWI